MGNLSILLIIISVITSCAGPNKTPDMPIVKPNVVFEEVDGLVAVEAEYFYKQTETEIRRWFITSAETAPDPDKDSDPPHVAGAGNNAYLEILPDTRVTHEDELIGGDNFANTPPPVIGVLHYKIHFDNPGRYYVWVRAFSAGSEDNGIHVGIDGTWPESGHRLQWCEGKHTWRWESKKRTERIHCGEAGLIWIDVGEKGVHDITFCMREDGFEFDKFILTKDPFFNRPSDAGPEVCVKKGKLPKPFPKVAVEFKYKEDWESLANHNEQPDWFQDAKFGIYFHWGVYSVPAFGSEWYPRNMHLPDNPVYKHHLEKYGPSSEFGYHDFVPGFKAEYFDADKWADLFQKAGARFAGPVAEHHDGFSMWASKATPWNVKKMGPQKDITGELAEAFRKRHIKLITTFHHARNLQRSQKIGEETWKSHYPYFENIPPSSTDEKLQKLYGNIPEEKWLESIWLAKLKEVIDDYQPDIMWFDSWMDEIPESYRQKFCTYYLNEAQNWGKEVVIVRKQDDLPLDVSVDDLEKSRKNRLEEKSWMTDETVSTGSWCYTENLKIKPAADVLHVLIDIVSKNGVLLLNISPKADGSIPQDQKQVLLEIGAWLKKYGEAIYGSRPWYTYGEGPTKEPEGHFENHEKFLKIKYSAEDVRYTRQGKTIYATLLGSPEKGKTILLKTFAADQLPEPVTIADVTIPGSDSRVDWELKDSGLQVNLPDSELEEMAVVLKVNTQ